MGKSSFFDLVARLADYRLPLFSSGAKKSCECREYLALEVLECSVKKKKTSKLNYHCRHFPFAKQFNISKLFVLFDFDFDRRFAINLHGKLNYWV